MASEHDLPRGAEADSVSRTLNLVGERWTLLVLREMFFGVRRYGRLAFPAVVALMRWGYAHLAGPQGPPIVLRHHDCGEPADPTLTCRHCHREIAAHNVPPEPGPGFP